MSASPLAFLGFRAARLRTLLGSAGRPAAADGSDRVIEAYPAAALARWGLPSREYKRDLPSHQDRRTAIIRAVVSAFPAAETVADRLHRSADALDALVCALVAPAHVKGLVDRIPADALADARTEGWIWIPRAHSRFSPHRDR